MVRLAAYGGLSCAAAAYVVLSAFRQRSNFFAAAVYLSKSNASMMLLWNFGIFLTIIFGRGVQTVFFGPLRLVEVERMHERVWYAITESLLALTIFRESFDTAFVILFVSLLFLKVFHWLASDRVEMMEQAPVIPRLFHIRMVAILSILWVVDTVLVAVAADSILTEGPSVMIMFASEYMILLATLLGTSLKYGGNAYDLRNDVPWENKSVFIFYVELACDFLKLATYLCFFSLILTFYGLPLNILRDVYMTARSFINKIRDLSRYRQATRNMDQRYPNATAEEMERLSDKTCIICREDMEARAEAQNQARDTRQGPNDTPKKLPCGHIFHFHCLRSWLERQQSCPTCRRPVLASSSSTARQPAAPPQPAPAQQPALAQAAALPQANRPQQTGAPSTSAEASAASRSPTPANAQLSVPTSTPPRPIAGVPSSSSRRRAGPENPLVAFQLRSVPKPPLVDIAQPSQPGNATAVMRSSPTGSADASSVANNKNTDESMKQKKPEASPSIGIGSSLDEQRKQRFEAALKRRGIAVSESSSSVRSSENGPQSLRSLTPTPTIKIDEVIAEPEKSASDGAQQTPQPATAVRVKAQPAAVQNILGQHATSLDSRASSPVTILDPMGAFGGSSLPTSSSFSSIPAWASPAVLTSSDPFAFSNTSQAAPSLPSLKSDDMPRLIPLFDPSDPSKPGYLARFLPSLAQSGFWPTINDTTQEPVHQPEMVHLPEDLDEGQLATLAEVTREGLQTRLCLLNSTQTTLQTCIGQLQKAMKVLDTGDVQGVLRTVSEIENIPAEQTDQATSQASQACTQDKGKAREVPTAMATTINHD